MVVHFYKSGENKRGGKNMVEKMNTPSSLVEVVDRIPDVGIAIDKFLAFLQNRNPMNSQI
jgi:hypothetical protein